MQHSSTESKGRGRKVLWRASAFVALALFAFLPSEACACLKTYGMSPVRMFLALQLVIVVSAVWLSPKGTRVTWAVVSILVALLSCIAAVLVAAAGPAASVGALLLPPLALAWSRGLPRFKRRREEAA
jgi:hypothetical protein